MPGIEPGISGLGMPSECAYHLRYFRADRSELTQCNFSTGLSERPLFTAPQFVVCKELVTYIGS